MKPGDFSTLAKDYAKYRAGYCETVLRALIRFVGAVPGDFALADVGAGTGIWTRMLARQGLRCFAVEPNAAMRAEGMIQNDGLSIEWLSGSSEKTGLSMQSVNWVTMASSFHWANRDPALREFSRILKPRGYLTILWNPRQIQGDPLQEKIEALIHERVPNLKRVSSGSDKYAKNYFQELTMTGDFCDPILFEGFHSVEVSKEHYLGAWRSVNDIQSQAGPKLFEELLAEISDLIGGLEKIRMTYQTRAWTARRVG